jgi:YesN/AraC family two-component response regulator
MIDSNLFNMNRIEYESMRLYVRYMVSLRCKLIVKDQLKKLDIKYSISVYGAITFLELVTDYRLNELNRNLKKHGLTLLSENESLLIDKIINTIIEVVHYSEELPKINFEDIIALKLGNENEFSLKIFSDVTGMSVLQFIVFQKIERAKEMLLYDDLSLPEISEKLNYKNQQLFTTQFVKLTGLTPEYFINLKKQRGSIDTQFNKNSIPDRVSRPIRSKM